MSIGATIDINGLLMSHSNSDYHVIIDMPISTSSYIINKDKISTLKQIDFTGDKTFGLELLEIFSNLHFNGIYINRSPITIMMINQLMKVSNIFSNYLKLLTNNFKMSISEYLLYESEDVVTKHEINQFCDEVDDLKNRLDLLNKKLNLLAK